MLKSFSLTREDAKRARCGGDISGAILLKLMDTSGKNLGACPLNCRLVAQIHFRFIGELSRDLKAQ